MTKNAEVIIVGGGPAGLSCALVLGRCRRKVLVFDTGNQRNKSTSAMHAFLSRDGEHPSVFLNKAKEELKTRYGIRVKKQEIVDVQKVEGGFNVHSANGELYFCKKLLLATGLNDVLPPIGRIEKYYGKSVFHCPYCDGWEARDKKWVVYAARKSAAVEICLRFRDWTNDITLLAADIPHFGARQRSILQRHGIRVCDIPVKSLKGRGGQLESVILQNGQRLPADVLFFSTSHQQQSSLAKKLGCDCSVNGAIHFNRKQQTNVPGLYAAGDLVRDMHLVIIAAAEGAKAAVAINSELNKEMRR